MSPDKSWKAVERRLARDVGTERKPCDGSRAGADFEDSLACYQVKVRRMLPNWLWSWLAGIQLTARVKDKAGVLILKQPGGRDTNAIVLLSWRAWVELHGAPTGRTDEQKEILDIAQ